jgi:hypothetical protein
MSFVILKILEVLLFLGLRTARLGSFKRVGTFHNLLVTGLNILLGCGIIMSRAGESKREGEEKRRMEERVAVVAVGMCDEVQEET